MSLKCDVIGCEENARSQEAGAICSKHSQQRYNDSSKGKGWPRAGDELEVGSCRIEEKGEHQQQDHLRDQQEDQQQDQQQDQQEDQQEEEENVLDTIQDIFKKKEKDIADLRKEIEDLKENGCKAEQQKIIDEDGNEIEIAGPVHYCFNAVLELCKARKLPYLCGPAGSGKTTIAQQIGDALGLETYITGALQTKFELVGFRSATGEYQETSLYKAFKYGGVFLFDEMDSSLAPALVAFNALLENGHYDFCGEKVERHPDFIAIAGANTIGHGATITYSGRTPLDRATLDRFAFIDFQYDNNLEALISGVDCIGKPKKINYRYKWRNKDSDKMDSCQEYAEKVTAYRSAAQSLNIQHIISPRATKNGCEMIRRGWKMSFIEDVFVWRGIEKIQSDRIKKESQKYMEKK